MTHGKTILCALGLLILALGTSAAQEPRLTPPWESAPPEAPNVPPAQPPGLPAMELLDGPPPLVEIQPIANPPQSIEPPPIEPPRDLVRFAAGTVEFELPRRWTVKEVPFRRELRLLVGPGEVPEDVRELQRGFWLGYRRHVDTGRLRTPLDAELQQSMARAAGRAARHEGPPREITVGGYPGLQQDLQLASPQPEWVRRASHVVVQTPWGTLELHGIAPVDVEDDLRAALNVVLQSLRFHEPRPLRPPTLPEVLDAGAALGSWKGLRERFHLTRDGRVEILFDRIAAFRIDQDGRVTLSQPGQRLTGQFTAQGDLIFITWDDGGLLNYRWKVYRGELLLVDHNRRSLRLKRLFDAAEK